MRHDEIKRKVFGIMTAVVLIAMVGTAFANTGCVYPWENMDCMIVGAAVGVDETGDLNVDGAVTSATVKALGFVSGGEVVANAYDMAQDRSDKVGIDASIYDTVRWDKTNRRNIDYERAAGDYTHYYGKDNWYNVFGENANDELREYPTTEYRQTLSAVSSMAMSEISSGGSITPCGQKFTALDFQSDWFKSYDIFGDISASVNGAIDNFTNFGFQQFVWKMDGFQGSNWGRDNSVLLVKPTNQSAITTTIFVNGLKVAETSGGFDEGQDDYVIDYSSFNTGGFTNKIMVISDLFYKINGNKIQYYAYVLTDAVKYLDNIGDELKVNIDVTMIEYTIPTWADISSEVEAYTSDLGESISTQAEYGFDSFTWDLKQAAAGFTDSIVNGISDGISSTIGQVDAPFGVDLLTGGITDKIRRSGQVTAFSTANKFGSYNYGDFFALVSDAERHRLVTVNSTPVDDTLEYVKGVIIAGGIRFECEGTGVGTNKHYVFQLGFTSTGGSVDNYYSDIIEAEDDGEGLGIGPNVYAPKNVYAFDTGRTSGERENTDDGQHVGSNRFQEWWHFVAKTLLDRYNDAIDETLNVGFPMLDIQGQIDAWINSGRVKTFSDTATHIKTAGFTTNGWQLLMSQEGSISDWNSFASQYSDIIGNFTAWNGNLTSEMLDIINRTVDDRLVDIYANMSIMGDTITHLMENVTYYYEQYNITATMLSDLMVLMRGYGFSSVWDETARAWVIDVNMDELFSNFNVIKGAYLSTPNYIFTEDLTDGQFFIPVRIDVTNRSMYDNMTIGLEAKKIGTAEPYEQISVVNCSSTTGNFYNIPVELESGFYDIRANVTFTNGTGDPADDVVLFTTSMPGFGQVRITELSLENIFAPFNPFNPLFVNGSSRNFGFELKLFDISDDMDMPQSSFIGGALKFANIAPGSITNIRWTVNYLTSHEFSGTIVVYDESGKVIHEEAIPTFTLKNAAFGESDRQRDTLSVEDFVEEREYAKIGDW